LTELTASLSLTFANHAMIGPDLRLLARVTGRDIF
jgi:hypothetical protein